MSCCLLVEHVQSLFKELPVFLTWCANNVRRTEFAVFTHKTKKTKKMLCIVIGFAPVCNIRMYSVVMVTKERRSNISKKNLATYNSGFETQGTFFLTHGTFLLCSNDLFRSTTMGSIVDLTL